MDLKKIPLSLYVHLPWCEKKCPYCDFNVTTNKKDGDEERLIKAIIQDIDNANEIINGRKFLSIYFGGGTPSLVRYDQIDKIIKYLKANDLVEANAEISFELNPNEVKRDYIKSISEVGINRLSIGIQSFNDETLLSLERNHSEYESLKALEVISEFKEVTSSIDLIYGVMNQGVGSLKKDLDIFISHDLDHLSLYQLTIEPNTIFYKKELKIPGENVIEEMESIAEKNLNLNGLNQYEISSWCKDGCEGLHNMNYWKYGDYYGVGPGAHSKITKEDGVYRGIKLKKLNSYIDDPSKNTFRRIPIEEIDLDIAMNFLRIKKGVSMDKVKKYDYLLSESFFHNLQEGIEKGLIEGSRFMATEKGYKFLNDTVNIFN
ncbi:MAG: radical SAM family heme chaperone HemW [Gammaproteobacteria bacterium]